MVKLPEVPKMVQVDLFEDGVFDVSSREVAIAKSEGSPWIDSDTLAESAFDWRKVDVRLTPLAKR
jgi:hypothetical protein